eukprot:Skav206545  [mRNA]  locus=scaffold504:305283:306050:+ [translate_table: standard]
MSPPDKANLSGGDFAQIAFCAVEHSDFEENGGAKFFEGKVNVENLREADQAGAVIGPNGRTLIREQMHKKLQVDAKDAPDVVVAAIVEHATAHVLQALIHGYVDQVPDIFCNIHQKLGKKLANKAIKMLHLGEANLAKRFLEAVEGVNETIYECFCNLILKRYVKSGAQQLFGTSLRKLSGSSFHPTRLSVPWVWSQSGSTMVLDGMVLNRMASVFNQFLLLRFFEIQKADLLPILKFLPQLPQGITHLSSWAFK